MLATSGMLGSSDDAEFEWLVLFTSAGTAVEFIGNIGVIVVFNIGVELDEFIAPLLIELAETFQVVTLADTGFVAVTLVEFTVIVTDP
jgi:hypothetical protein